MFTAEFERAMMLTVRPMTDGITAVCLCACQAHLPGEE
jgi:hypothetical protein